MDIRESDEPVRVYVPARPDHHSLYGRDVDERRACWVIEREPERDRAVVRRAPERDGHDAVHPDEQLDASVVVRVRLLLREQARLTFAHGKHMRDHLVLATVLNHGRCCQLDRILSHKVRA